MPFQTRRSQMACWLFDVLSGIHTGEDVKRSFYATMRTHHGVVVMPRTLPNNRPAAMACAIATWMDRFGPYDPGVGFLVFL